MRFFFSTAIFLFCYIINVAQPGVLPADMVNPFMGTTTLWDSADLGYKPTHRAWGGEAFPGASLPNAMVQVTPVTQWRSGSGYQYEDTVIYAFAHTSKGHWNLCYAPFIAVSGNVDPENYYSGFSHERESASPGYYQVFLEKYNINAEVTSSLRAAFHRYTYQNGKTKKFLADLSRSNERVKSWDIQKADREAFSGFQEMGRKFYFYGITNVEIEKIEKVKGAKNEINLISFIEGDNPANTLEIKIGFSYVSVENAKNNLEAEIAEKSFEEVRSDASEEWNRLLSKIKVTGGTQSQQSMFYSTLYRSFLWPILLSDVNGDYINEKKQRMNKGFRYYAVPSFWDTYRNKLILLGMLSPDVTADVINSLIDRGEISGYMPSFFHGDHASVFIAGSYLRGIKNFDIGKAYKILLNNAFKPGKGGRPHLEEYMSRGWISEEDVADPNLETVAKAAVTKTQEYAYDDYATALIAGELGDKENYDVLMKRSQGYKYLFDPETQFMRGRLSNGEWITPFDPQKPFYEYMYREANGWQSTFFAPHDPVGLVNLYKSHADFENKLDSLFIIPWQGYEAYNFTGFIGQYCHGNQPDHGSPYFYYFVDKQEKSQNILNLIMNDYYGMGKEKLAYAGMDDAGEMSAWYVFNAIGIYTFSPADPEYLITVPIFNEVEFKQGKNIFRIIKKGQGNKIVDVRLNKQKINGYFISHHLLESGGDLEIFTQ